MIAVLTGDVKNSRADTSLTWLKLLKEGLNRYGKEPKEWEIYRGDSFQLEVSPGEALEASIYLKANLKQIKNIDVRIAIGLGQKHHDAAKITESNGTAFTNSGKCFEQLKKKTLAIQSLDTAFDTQLNLLIELASLTMNNWTPTIAKTIKTALENPGLTQVALAKELEKSQGNISEELSRSGYDGIKQLLEYYQNQVTLL